MELPEKLPKPAGYLACEKMSKRDWEAYFKKREKDHFVSKEDNEKLLDAADLAYDQDNIEKYVEISNKVMISPENAISLKNSFGFKKIWDMNLFLAKQKYPEEF